MSQLNPNITTHQVSNVSFQVDGREDCPCYLSDVNKQSDMGIVLLQEWWGLNVSIAKTADQFAQQGFMVISPDLYRGKVAQSTEEAGHLIQGLDWEGAVKDCEASCAFLKSRGCKKVGITGFCMGGALVFASCSALDCFDAGVPFYGIPNLEKFPLANVNCPLLLQFARQDEAKGFSDPESAEKVHAQLQQLGKNSTLRIWEESGHAFMNRDRETYKPDQAAKALEESTQFFTQYLKQ